MGMRKDDALGMSHLLREGVAVGVGHPCGDRLETDMPAGMALPLGTQIGNQIGLVRRVDLPPLDKGHQMAHPAIVLLQLGPKPPIARAGWADGGKYQAVLDRDMRGQLGRQLAQRLAVILSGINQLFEQAIDSTTFPFYEVEWRSHNPCLPRSLTGRERFERRSQGRYLFKSGPIKDT